MRMRDRVVEAGKDQVIIDEACGELVEKMRGGLVEVTVRKSKSAWATVVHKGDCKTEGFHDVERVAEVWQ